MTKAIPEHTTADGPSLESDDFKALALRREWKQRLRNLIDAYYYKTPLKERQWWKLQEIADECARIPGATKIDDNKRNHMVDFLCRAIFRGEFKDDKGRMQVANLHPSPLAPIRLDVKWLAFDQLLKLAADLFVRRKECIECLARNNIDVPRAWLPSQLTGPHVPANDHEPPPVEECWQVIDEPQHRQRELHRAWTVVRQLWSNGPPLAMSKREITEQMTEATKPLSSTSPDTTGVDPNLRKAGGFSEKTVDRLLKNP
jgi:hypothetical protein